MPGTSTHLVEVEELWESDSDYTTTLVEGEELYSHASPKQKGGGGASQSIANRKSQLVTFY